MKQFKKHISLFLIGSILYYNLELIYRGYSHVSMFILGGVCFVLIGLINEYLDWETPLWKQQLISVSIITTLELITGIIVNVWLGLDVWDYSHLPLNLLGQICISYSILWFFLSACAIILDDYLRYWIFNEEKPHYKIV